MALGGDGLGWLIRRYEKVGGDGTQVFKVHINHVTVRWTESLPVLARASSFSTSRGSLYPYIKDLKDTMRLDIQAAAPGLSDENAEWIRDAVAEELDALAAWGLEISDSPYEFWVDISY